MSAAKDYLKLHFVVLIWGFTAILGLLINIPSLDIVFYRTLIAFVFLGLVLFFKKQNFRIGKNEIFKILGTGAIIAFHWMLFFGAARVSNASVCLAGIATCSLWTSLIEPLFNKRKVKIFEVILGIVVLLGLYIIFRFEFDNALGLLMAIGAAFLAAVFSVINGGFTKKHSPYMITFYEMLGACIASLLFIVIFKIAYAGDYTIIHMPTVADWGYLLLLSVICTVYAFSMSVELMKRISAFVVNLTVNLEPIYGIILALIIFGEKEQMEGGFYVGTGVILLSVLIYPLVNKFYKRKALELDNLR